jgi:membrane fusion protein (multidrug efflux system)
MTATDDSKPDWAKTRRDREREARRAEGLPPRPRYWLWVALAAAVAAVVIGATVISRQQAAALRTETAGAPAERVMQVTASEVTRIEPQVLRETVRVTGTVNPRQQTQLSSEVSGRVNAVNVRPGNTVQRGDVLVQISIENLGVQLQQQQSTAQATRTQLELAESQLARARELLGRGFATSSSVEQAEASVNQLRANLAALESQVRTAGISLGNATITAPFSGTVATRSVDPGQAVSVNTPLLTIVDLSKVDVQAYAPSSDIARVQLFQQAVLRIEGITERNFEGKVERISPVAAEGTRTIPVFIGLDNPDGTLRGGMFAAGEITVAEKADAFALPPAAIRTDADGDYVLKVEGEGLVRQPVTEVTRWNGGRLVEVSGLAVGDLIVTTSLPQLQPGSRIALEAQP